MRLFRFGDIPCPNFDRAAHQEFLPTYMRLNFGKTEKKFKLPEWNSQQPVSVLFWARPARGREPMGGLLLSDALLTRGVKTERR